jgi:predicted phosphoribosyltransferase
MKEGRLITEEALRDKLFVFEDRSEGGRRLSEKLLAYKDTEAIILAIPSGGVPVAAEVARILNLPLDLILVRKIQIPWDTEAGFGAIDPEGEVIFNRALLETFEWLTEDEINSQINKTKDILKKRNDLFRAGRPFPVIENRTVIIIDDGLASGYTMLVALRYVRRKKAGKIVAAVPTGNVKTVELILLEADEVICLNIRGGFSFAVADSYQHWYDVTDEEVLAIMKQLRENKEK